MRERLRDFDRHRHDIELRVHALRGRSLVARDVGLGNKHIHDAARVAFRRIG